MSDGKSLTPNLSFFWEFSEKSKKKMIQANLPNRKSSRKVRIALVPFLHIDNGGNVIWSFPLSVNRSTFLSFPSFKN